MAPLYPKSLPAPFRSAPGGLRPRFPVGLRPRFPVGLGCLLALALTRPLLAQTVSGRLVEELGGSPIEGVFVVLVDSDGNGIAGALTDQSGRFVISAPSSGRYTLTAERIGYESFSSGPLSLSPGEVLDHDLTMPVRPVELDALSVEGERQCEIRPEAGRNVALAWEEARKALTTTAWTEEQRTYRFTTRLHDRTLDPRDLHVLEEEAEIQSGLSVNPFRAVPVEELAASGYVRRSSPDSTTYYAPDAHVLLSDRFLDDHCFHLVEGEGVRSGLIGLVFEPLLRDDRTDISGVLWLDQGDARLRFIEYRYENLKETIDSDDLGGRLSFRRLPGGAWIVERWHIRMPLIEPVIVRERTGAPVPGNAPRTRTEYRLTAIKEQGGEVLTVSHPSGRVAAGAGRTAPGRGALTGQVFDSTSNRPLAGAEVALVGTNHRTTTDADGRYTLQNLPAGEFHVAFSHLRTTSLRLGAVLQRARISRGEIGRVDLAVPPLRVLIPSLCPDHTETDLGIIVGTVARTGAADPVAGATVRVSTNILGVIATPDDFLEPILETTSDQNGSFVLCGVSPGLRVYAGATVSDADRTHLTNVEYFTTRAGIQGHALRIEGAAGSSGGS